MRTTINVDDELLQRAKQEAVRSRRTLTAVIEDALRQSLSGAGQPDEPEPYRVEPFQGRGLRSGADLDDSAALLDHLEGEG